MLKWMEENKDMLNFYVANKDRVVAEAEEEVEGKPETKTTKKRRKRKKKDLTDVKKKAEEAKKKKRASTKTNKTKKGTKKKQAKEKSETKIPLWFENCTLCSSGIAMEVEQRVQKEGSKPYTVAREMASEVKDLAALDDQSEVLAFAKRILNRYRSAMGKDTPTRKPKKEISEKQKKSAVEETTEKTKEDEGKENIISQEFVEVFALLLKLVKKAKKDKWKKTTREAIRERLSTIYEFIKK